MTESDLSDRLPPWLDPIRIYLTVLLTVAGILLGGAILFPKHVWRGFLWKYFWGPVYADAHGADCAVLKTGSEQPVLEGSRAACSGEPYGAVVGYTTVNEIGYAITLVFGVVGVVLLLRHLELGDSPSLFYGLLPFMFLGGAVRVVEDANNAALRVPSADPLFVYPWNTLVISPVIYLTLFVITLIALAVAIWLSRAQYVSSYHIALAGIGTVLLTMVIVVLLGLGVTTEYVHFLPQFTIVTVVIASLITWITWQGIEEYAAWLNDGTGRMGAVVLWGHAIDGTANVVGLDWGAELGYPGGDLVGKHPVNRAIVDTTAAVLPENIVAITGDAWPFLVLKIAVVVVVLAIFDETVFDESPRYAVLMLVAILAVGLGPGTRDMLRATFGV